MSIWLPLAWMLLPGLCCLRFAHAIPGALILPGGAIAGLGALKGGRA